MITELCYDCRTFFYSLIKAIPNTPMLVLMPFDYHFTLCGRFLYIIDRWGRCRKKIADIWSMTK